MKFIHYWKKIKSRLDKECTRWVPDFPGYIPIDQVKNLRQALLDGKRMRGCFLCLVCEALEGKIEEAIPRAIAIEYIQAASLIHDDYVDQDTSRRNHPAIWTIEGSRRAVLFGDLLFATAIRKMTEMGHTDGLVISQAIATMAQGAYDELLSPSDLFKKLTKKKYSPGLYNLIIHLKTGALFGAAAKLGAVSAKASTSFVHHAFEFGVKVGEAYQILDDLQEINQLEKETPSSPARIAPFVPLLLYFHHNIKPEILKYLRGKKHHQWLVIKEVLPHIKTKMESEIGARLSLARQEIKDFPDNSHTQILFTVPSEIIRLMS